MFRLKNYPKQPLLYVAAKPVPIFILKGQVETSERAVFKPHVRISFSSVVAGYYMHVGELLCF